MDLSFVLTPPPPEPLDIGALIDRAFPGEPVHQAARAIVAKLLTDGEKVRYEDGRIALYLATDHRPAVQALLDTMPAQDRQHLLDLLDRTRLAPALEGLILGRWPSRAFLLEAREIFRIPELRQHLPADPSAALREKLLGVCPILEDRSPESPVRALLDLLARVERDAPRTPTGSQVSLDEYYVLCRSDPQTLALARELSKELQDVSVALFRALAGVSSFYLPRTPGGSNGEGEALNVIDCADIADYCSFLCCLAREILLQYLARIVPGQDNPITSHAGTRITRSVSEALLITFLQRRFPGMSVPADIEGDGLPPADQHKRLQGHFDRTVPLFRQTWSLFASFRQAARALPPLFVRGEELRLGSRVGDMLEALEESVHQWTALRVLSEYVKMPRRVAPVEAPAAAFRHPLPDLALLRYNEGVKQMPDRLVPTAYITTTHCKHFLDTAVYSFAGEKYASTQVGTGIGVHVAGGGACLSAHTCVPLGRFLHPEDPASIIAAFLERQAGRDVRHILKLLQCFEVEQQVREAARDVPRLDFLYWRRFVRGRLLFWRERIKHFIYLVMRRRDAQRLGILARVRALPPREQALLREHFDYCPEDPVALKIDVTDEPDDDGGDGPPPPPPTPQQREKPEDAPTSEKVGVG